MTTNNPVCVYDFTLKYEGITRVDVERWLIGNCKTWCFAREVGSGGYEHYQGRISLRKPVRISQQITVQPWVNHCAWSVTAKKNTKNVHYICKDSMQGIHLMHNEIDDEEEIDLVDKTASYGPWTEDDVVAPARIPRQVREIKSLRPWQQSIIDQCDVWDTRTINMVYDPRGNIGKSVLVAYMRAHNLARKLPPVNDYKDVMRMCCDMPVSRCYIFDMPRAMKKDRLGSLYTAIEELKSGYCWDDRYKFKERFFDCPNIWVFANTLPDMTLLSADRWRLWHVVDHKLEHYDLKEGEE